MTKAELEKDRDEWKQQAESLKEDLDSLNEAYSEIENKLYDYVYEYANNPESLGIKDIDNFIFRLKVENLYTEELENFIEYYLKYHNE